MNDEGEAERQGEGVKEKVSRNRDDVPNFFGKADLVFRDRRKIFGILNSKH